VRLHDRRHALQVLVQLCERGGTSYGSPQPGQQMSDHRVVLLQVTQRVAELGVLLGDRGEQVTILALVMGRECRAEPVTEQQQIFGHWLDRLAGGKRLPGHR
jgi:hypothetical protein